MAIEPIILIFNIIFFVLAFHNEKIADNLLAELKYMLKVWIYSMISFTITLLIINIINK